MAGTKQKKRIPEVHWLSIQEWNPDNRSFQKVAKYDERLCEYCQLTIYRTFIRYVWPNDMQHLSENWCKKSYSLRSSTRPHACLFTPIKRELFKEEK